MSAHTFWVDNRPQQTTFRAHLQTCRLVQFISVRADVAADEAHALIQPMARYPA